MPKKCPVCKATVPVSEGKGRPRTFCSPGCTSLADNRRGRIERRLDKLDGELREAELVLKNPGKGIMSGVVDPYGREPKQVVADLNSELKNLETQMLTLLGGDG